MLKKIQQMKRIREKNRIYFNKNHTGPVQCEYCFELLESFNLYRYRHVRKCTAKQVFKAWLEIMDLEIELNGVYQHEPYGLFEVPVVHGHSGSGVDTDGDDGMSDEAVVESGVRTKTGELKNDDQDVIDLSVDPMESHVSHQEHMMMEEVIYQNLRDNTEEGRKRMAAKAKRRSKRGMDSDTDDDDDDEDPEQKRLNAKVMQFKKIVDFTGVPGMDLTVKQFIVMS